MSEGIPRLAEKLERLFAVVPRTPASPQLHSNDSVAAALGALDVSVTGTHISYLRSGRRDNPSARLLAGLAQVFQVPLTYFFDDRPEELVAEDLTALVALRDPRARSLMLRARGVSAENLSHVEGILDQVRTLEGLDPYQEAREQP